MVNFKTFIMETFELENIGGWLPKKAVMEFLGYKETQMREFMIQHAQHLIVSKIGRRSFIKERSLIEVLEMNNIKHV